MADLLKYSDNDSRRIINIANAYDSGPTVALLEAIDRRKGEIMSDVIKKPEIHNEIKRDVRYKLGMLAAFEWIEQLTPDAKRYIENIDEGDT